MDLKYASFHSLTLQDMKWPVRILTKSTGLGPIIGKILVFLNIRESPEDHSWPVTMEGMTYQHISTGDKTRCREEMLGILIRSPYRDSVYERLESFFRQQGSPDNADEVYIAKRQRERREALQGVGAKIWSLFLDLSVGYGRRPARVLLPCVVFVSIGCFVFSGKIGGMKRKDVQNKAPHNYCSFWYSLDLFIPLINLHAVEFWTPGNRCRFAKAWMRIHTMAGWILIPIALAALASVIK
jgi:hypothetical protein